MCPSGSALGWDQSQIPLGTHSQGPWSIPLPALGRGEGCGKSALQNSSHSTPLGTGSTGSTGNGDEEEEWGLPSFRFVPGARSSEDAAGVPRCPPGEALGMGQQRQSATRPSASKHPEHPAGHGHGGAEHFPCVPPHQHPKITPWLWQRPSPAEPRGRRGPLCGMLPASERGDTGMGGRQSPDTPPRDALSIATPHSPPEPAGKGN